MRLTNVSPLGDLDVPLLRRVVARGETVDVTAEQARILLAQFENYAPADDEAQPIADGHRAEQDARDGLEGQPPEPGDLKAAWVAYAETQGDENAAEKTKAELVEEYGSDV